MRSRGYSPIKAASDYDLLGSVFACLERMQEAGENLPVLLKAHKDMGHPLKELALRTRKDVRRRLTVLKDEARTLGIKRP